MELAVDATTPGLSIYELAELCQFAEELGYRHAWEADVGGPDPFVLASAIAARTRHMDLGVAAMPVYTRTAAALATGALSVSNTLGGRAFHLGLGSSSETIVSQWHGIAFTDPLRRVEETVEAIRAVLNGATEYVGRLVQTRRFRPTVAATGPIELWVAALRPRMLALAGKVGDGVCLNLMPARIVPIQVEAVRKGAAASGRPAPAGVMARLQVQITDDPQPLRDRLRSNFIGPYLAQPVYNQYLAWMGYEEEAQAVAEAWRRRDREAMTAAIPDRLVDDLTMLGPAAVVRERLDEFAEAGLTVASLSMLTPSRQAVEDTLRALAP